MKGKRDIEACTADKCVPFPFPLPFAVVVVAAAQLPLPLPLPATPPAVVKEKF